MYYIYILYSPNYDKYYVGYSNDPYRRVLEHNTKPFNTYTSKYRPWTLAAVFECIDIIRQRAAFDENRANPLKKINPEVFARMEDEEIREGN